MGQGLADMGTHFPVLAAAVAGTEGPILELGCGHYSTPMLHQMGLLLNRRVVTVETDAAWMRLFEDMSSELHVFKHIGENEWERYPIEGRHWGVAFVDCKPGEYRKILVTRLKDHATYIVVHDTETDHNTGADYGLEPVFETFLYRSDYCRYRPYTTVVSDARPFPISPCDQTWNTASVQNPSERPKHGA